jgi:PhoPQ-activated pathogenicity-related protein
MISAMSTPFRTLWHGALVGILLGVPWAANAKADLIDYVTKPEPAFSWKLTEKKPAANGVIYEIHLVSQVWRDIQWEHALHVYQPKNAAPKSTMLLWNTGGSPGLGDVTLGMLLATKIQAPCAFLYNIPNQPFFGGKKEDALIAETFVRFLSTKDESWPLLFPMVKSVVKALDAVQAFSQQEWNMKVDKFIISGASKRGWTTWLTAAADPRVQAIAPMVIDTLNMPKQNAHQLEMYGAYSKEIADYTTRGLVPMPPTPEAKRLWSMVDPYFYRSKLQLPKLIVNGSNDPYWTLDSLNLYWDDLKGDKWVLYVPNAGHNLHQRTENGTRDISRALNGLAAFARHQITGKPLPQVTWKHDGSNDRLRLVCQANPAPDGARLWVCESPTQDFREATWRDQKVKIDNGKVVAEVMPPAEGFRAFYAELDFAIEGLEYHLSTQVRIAGSSSEESNGQGRKRD